MIRQSWVGALALVGSTPAFLVVVLMMGFVWAAATQIAWATPALSFGREAAALLVACCNAPLSAWLFANFLHLKADLSELRMPRQRQVAATSMGVLLLLMVVVPGALALSWRSGLLVVTMVELSSLAGIAAAFVWAAVAAGRSPQRGAHATGGSLALRVALGAPYAPASCQTRLLQLALVAVVLFAAPLLVIAFGRALTSPSFALLMHAAEFLGFVTAIGLCWVWPLSRAVALFDPARGALAELALLPGLGDNVLRRRRMYRVIFGPPAIALVALWVIAILAAWLERPAEAAYIRLLVTFLIVPLFTVPIFLGQIAQPRAGGGARVATSAMLMLSPFIGLTPAIWNTPAQAFTAFPSLLHWMGVGIVMLLIFFGVYSFMSLRNLAQRPHPFVDVSS